MFVISDHTALNLDVHTPRRNLRLIVNMSFISYQINKLVSQLKDRPPLGRHHSLWSIEIRVNQNTWSKLNRFDSNTLPLTITTALIIHLYFLGIQLCGCSPYSQQFKNRQVSCQFQFVEITVNDSCVPPPPPNFETSC